jgi:translation elongation factor EF-1alpha
MEFPILKGSKLIFHRHALDIPIQVLQIEKKMNPRTKEVEQVNPFFIPQNSLADIQLALEQASNFICIETFENSRPFGKFV